MNYELKMNNGIAELNFSINASNLQPGDLDNLFNMIKSNILVLADLNVNNNQSNKQRAPLTDDESFAKELNDRMRAEHEAQQSLSPYNPMPPVEDLDPTENFMRVYSHYWNALVNPNSTEQ